MHVSCNHNSEIVVVWAIDVRMCVQVYVLYVRGV